MNNATQLLPEYKGKEITKSFYVERCEDVVSENNNLLDVIFAPDPETGLPRSDIGIILSKDSVPEVAKYIQDNLMKPLPTSGTSDIDEALATVKTQRMSIDDYKAQLGDFIKNNYKGK